MEFSLLFIAVSAAFVCWAYGRYNAVATARDWEMAFDVRHREVAEAAELDAAIVAARADGPLLGARRALKDGLDEATRLLALSFEAIEEATPDRIARLKAMVVMAQMAAAVEPTPPILPGGFRTGGVRAVTSLGAALHHFLVTAAERLVLRLYVLIVALGLAARGMRRDSRPGVPRRSAEELAAAIERYAAGLEDWKGLDRERLLALRTLLASITATRRERPPVFSEP